MVVLSFKKHKCTFQEGSFDVLPDEIIRMCEEGYILYYSEGTVLLYDDEMLREMIKSLSENDGREADNLRRMIFGCSEMIEDANELGAALLELLKRYRDKHADKSVLNINIMPFNLDFVCNKSDNQCVQIKIVDSKE